MSASEVVNVVREGFKGISDRLDPLERHVKEHAERLLSLEQKSAPPPPEPGPATSENASIWVDARGEHVRVLGRRDRMSSVKSAGWNPEADAWARDGLTTGAFIRALITGARSSAEQKALNTTTGAAGGYAVPTPVASEWIDRLRARTVVIECGATTVPLSTSTLRIARVDGDATAEWLAESATQAPTDPVFGSIAFAARTLRCLIRASRELAADAPNFASQIEEVLARQFAAELDRVALVGTGTGAEPRGIFHVAGVATVSMGTNGAALTNFDPLVDLHAELLAANAEPPFAMVYAPRTAGSIDKLKATDNQPLLWPAGIRELPKFVTSSIPINQVQGSSTDCSCVLAGDFRDLLLGVRQELIVELVTTNRNANFEVEILASLRADVQLARPASFARLIGIRP